ncbi:MAG: hypothetical protein K2O32_11800 [Acetatifactor sp.]|nr:hypothetical protein [Acetatifactor sp.]
MKENETPTGINEDQFDDYEMLEMDEGAFDSMIGLEELELNYEAHVMGFEGENFFFSIYFEDGFTDAKFEETDNVIGEFFKSYDEQEIYLGYLDVLKQEDKVSVFLDLGNVEPEYCNTAIHGILNALNNVSGIKTVLINENSGFDF